MSIAYNGQSNVSHMCTSHDVLVISRGFEGVFDHTLNREELKWRVSGKPPGIESDMDTRGVVADGQGHLFVCDYNNRCVHLLSATDGVHLGVVVKKGENGLGKPKEVAWHGDSASLVVAHYNHTGCFILSVFSRK